MVAPARIDSTPRTALSDSHGSHTVERGDTLSQIARDVGVSLQALIQANPQIANPNRIYPGDRIRIPAAATGGAAASGATASGGGNAEGMRLSDSGVNLIKAFEGLRLSAYQDSGGIWTIGYGHIGGVQPGDRITQGQAEELLRKDTGWAQDAVRQQVHVPLTQRQFDALTSFTFNLGAGALNGSTLLSKLNAGDYAGAQAEFGRFVHAGGRVLQGLVRRRAAEADLFGSDAPSGTAAGAPGASTTPSARNASNASNASKASKAGNIGNDGDGSRGTRGTGGEHTVRRGDTLWDIARHDGVTLQALIAANPQIANPNLIIPGQSVHLPGGRHGGSVAPGAAPAPGDPGAAAGDARDAAVIARRYLHRNASELKRSGDLPMDRSVPSNICCANFVSAVLQRAGLLPDRLHTNSVDQLDSTLRARGWRPVDAAHARPGDVVIIQGGGASHTVMVESNANGQLKLIGSNNVNADGTQQVTVGSANWALSHGAVILTPPST